MADEEPIGNKVTTVYPEMTIDLWEAYENEEIVKLTDNYRYVDNGQGGFVAEANPPEPLITEGRDDSRLNESEDFNGWGGVADAHNVSFDKDQLVHTVKGTARAVSGGIIDAANGFLDLTGEMGEVLNDIVPYGYLTYTTEDGFGFQEQKPTDIAEWQLPSPPRGDTMFEPFARGMVQFIAGLALTKGSGTSTSQLVGRGGVSAMLFDPVHGGLVTVLRHFGIGTEALEFFDSQVSEDAPAYRKLYGRLQNGLEELHLGFLFEGLWAGIKNIHRVPELKQKAIDTIKNMEIKVDPNTLSMGGGGAITIGKKDGGGPPITPERVVDDLGFYSQLREEINLVKQEKFGSIEQFTNMMKGKVKQEELDWSGLNEAFQGKKFTKQEVIDWLDDNHVELEEIRKTGSKVDDMDNPYAEDYEIDIQPTDDQPLISEEVNENYTAIYDNYEVEEIMENHVDEIIASHARANTSLNNAQKVELFTKIIEAIGDETDIEEIGKILEAEGIENASSKIEDSLRAEAQDNYDNFPVYEWSNEEGYRISGFESYLRLEDSAGSQFAEVSSLSEAEIQMRGRLIEDGIIDLEPDADDIVNVTPSDDTPALGDNNPPKDNIVEGGPTQWGRYKEDGGTNYREFLIRNKNYKGDPSYVALKLTSDELEELKRLDAKAEPDKLAVINALDQNLDNPDYKSVLTDAENIRYTELMKKQGIVNNKARFAEFRQSVHWRGENEKNVIFHVRLTDRTGPNGERILYGEELQSDWSSKGGGRAGEVSFKSETQSAEIAVIEKRIEVVNKEMPILEGELTAAKTSQEAIISADKINAKKKVVEELGRQLRTTQNQTIPRGPYVTDTKKWTALAIKRLIRIAVEEGYDGIAFAPGAVQYERWNNGGLFEFYDYTIPSVIGNVMKKNLKIQDYKLDSMLLDDVAGHKGSSFPDDIKHTIEYKVTNKDGETITKQGNIPGKERITIIITPEIREKVMKGISLFSVGAIATEGMLEEKEPANGY